MMKDDEDWWIDCWQFRYGGGRTTCFCEKLDISCVDARARHFLCIEMFWVLEFHLLFIVCLCISLPIPIFYLPCAIVNSLCSMHSCATCLHFHVVCEIIFLFLSQPSPFFSKRSICGSHGLVVFMTLTGPLLLVFFPIHTHTHTNMYAVGLYCWHSTSFSAATASVVTMETLFIT